MDNFANSSDRLAAITEAANRKGINPLVVEKDFWACWCLKRVFQMDDIPGHIFKGGTSLSKVYGLINRFSEDVDISIDRSGLGFGGDKDPANLDLSNKKRDQLCSDLKQACSEFIEHAVLPRFQKACGELLGDSGWSASMDPRDRDRQSILFAFPRCLASYVDGAYLTPSVLLEFGCRGDQWPASDRTVRPFVAEELPDLFGEPDVSVRVLAAERTFWEKVTLIHAENHRPSSSPPRDRLSRHYSDIAAISRSEIGARAIDDLKMLVDVVAHKRIFFRSAWANYDGANPGTLALVPNQDLEKYLRSDYEQMREMFFGEVEDFDHILESIRNLESKINGNASNSSGNETQSGPQSK